MHERRATILAVFGSGFCVGLAAAMFAGAGNLLKDSHLFALTSAEYGAMFLPLYLAAVLTALLAARLVRQGSAKRPTLLGLLVIGTGMLLLAVSPLALPHRGLAYLLLLIASGLCGAGFGLSISTLNVCAYALFPQRRAAAVTGLHALLGLGLAISPSVIAALQQFGLWWLAPSATAAALWLVTVGTSGLSWRLPAIESSDVQESAALPSSMRKYVLLAFLYGLSESTFSNWGAVLLFEEKGLSLAQAGLGLTIFWGAVTVGRAGFTWLSRGFRTRMLYVSSAALIATAFGVLALAGGTTSSLLGMALAGLACSYFFPVSVSLATADGPYAAARISCLLVTAIMVGIALGTFSAGAFRDSLHASLTLIFGLSCIYGLLMVVFSLRSGR